jgi:Uma2 family endonuclease
MIAVEERSLSPEAFHAQYDGRKPYFEFWNGEAVQKSMPTFLHSLIQRLLANLLEAMGYQSGQEIALRLDAAYEPIPDVIAGDHLAQPYPVDPFEIAIEILSPEDTFSRVLLKCRLYRGWGIRRILVVDPETREIFSFEDGVLRETETIARRGDETLTAAHLWQQVDLRLNRA